jgi:hypothetical protein
MPEDEQKEETTITVDQQHQWTINEFKIIRQTYERLTINSTRLLENAKVCKTKESVLQYLIVVLGLSSSFLSALPGIDNTIRTYITSTFTLLVAIIGGWMSKKTYGQKAGKYYSAYQEYKDLVTTIDNIMVSLQSDRNYETFNYHISKVESKYEIFLPVDYVDTQKITKECETKFDTVFQRFATIDKEKLLEKYKSFIDRKSYIYLHECKLKMYRGYVFKEKVRDHTEINDILDCYDYENFCRIHYPDKYKNLTKVYDEYVKSQLACYYKLDDFNNEKIEIELSTKKIMSVDEREFTRRVHEKFTEYQSNIKQREYNEEEKDESIDENYSLDLDE